MTLQFCLLRVRKQSPTVNWVSKPDLGGQQTLWTTVRKDRSTRTFRPRPSFRRVMSCEMRSKRAYQRCCRGAAPSGSRSIASPIARKKLCCSPASLRHCHVGRPRCGLSTGSALRTSCELASLHHSVPKICCSPTKRSCCPACCC